MSDDHSSTVGDIQKFRNATDTAPKDASAQSSSEPGLRPADWPKELGGPKGPEPTRYGDWERKGRCSDF